MNYFIKTPLLFVSLIVFYACNKNENKPIEEETPVAEVPVSSMIKIGETYLTGAKTKAVVYSPKALIRGYNELYVSLFDSLDGSPLQSGHLNISPIMTMGSSQHASPVENTKDTLSTNGYFRSAVVFTMPGTTSEWALQMDFHNHKNGLSGKGSLGVNVTEGNPTKFRSTILSLDSNAIVYISYIQPSAPKVGINDFEIVVHKKISGSNYKPIENYAIEIVPEMPSMGHGSPNNVNPVHSNEGHYKGKVNFTMTGLWQIKLKLSKNGTLLSDDQYFEITLQ